MKRISLRRSEWRERSLAYGIGFFIALGVGSTITAVLQAFYGWN